MESEGEFIRFSEALKDLTLLHERILPLLLSSLLRLLVPLPLHRGNFWLLKGLFAERTLSPASASI